MAETTIDFRSWIQVHHNEDYQIVVENNDLIKLTPDMEEIKEN